MPDSQQQPEPFDHDTAATGSSVLLLCGARLVDGRTVDVRLGSGRIEAVDTTGSPTPGGKRTDRSMATSTGLGTARKGTPTPRIDLSGYLLLPAPAEPHAHYDSALTAGSTSAPGMSHARVQQRATEAALIQLAHGATALRTHVRIGGGTGLRSLEAVLRARRTLRGLVELSATAVPLRLTGNARSDGVAILRDAVGMGATGIGGCPDLDPDPLACIETVLALAAELDCPVDLHTDGDDPDRLIQLASAARGPHRQEVTIGPCGGLARLPRAVVLRVADRLATAGVNVVCLPQGRCGSVVQRHPAPATPVRMLRGAGVRVTAGSGALRDIVNPVGRGDPLEAAYLLSSLGEAGPETAYDTVSAAARAVMGLPAVRVEAGYPAELLAVRGEEIGSVLSLAYSRIVVHRGRVVARTSAVREYAAATVALELPRQSQR